MMQYKAIFISDAHLGTRASNASLLLNFLKHNESEYLFLVGDIIDGWRLKQKWYWTQEHNDVVQKILRKSRKGTKVVYVPGNHDEFLRNFYGQHFGEIEVVEKCGYGALNDNLYLITHGDQYDFVIQHVKWLAYVGDWAYATAFHINRIINFFRRKMGLEYWSFSKWAKYRVKEAVSFIGNFETAMTHEAKADGYDGVICGHIHTPDIKKVGDIEYMNCGDFVENCTALVEHLDGTFEIITWKKEIL